MFARRTRENRWLVLVGIAAIALTLGIAELVLRAMLPASTRYLVHFPTSTTVFTPSPAFVPGVADTARFVTNAFGIRGPEFGPDSAEFRILAVGGSTTECAALDGPETWPAVVGEALPRTTVGQRVWVGNAGRSGLMSRDHVVEFKYFVPQLPRIDVLIVLVGINDVTSALRQGFGYRRPPPITDSIAERAQVSRTFIETPGPFHRPATDFLLGGDAPWYKATALWQLAKRARVRFGPATLVQDPDGRVYETWRSHRRSAPRFLDSLPDLSEALEEYRYNLNQLADLAARNHAGLVLMTQPVLWARTLSDSAQALLWLGGTGDFQEEAGHEYFTASSLRGAMNRYNTVVLDVCAARRLHCVDLASQIAADTRWFYDDTHFTEAGARLVGQIVAADLPRSSSWPKSTRPSSTGRNPGR